MRVWRVCKPAYAARAFDGEGAKRDGGRWNSPGRPLAYASDTAALATVEKLTQVALTRALALFVLVAAEIPDEDVAYLDPAELPEGWDAYPPRAASKEIGDAWLVEGVTLALRVPSAVLPGDNVLVNPAHPRFADVVVESPVEAYARFAGPP